MKFAPGKILTGMVKRTLKNSNCFSINTIADIKNTDNEFKKIKKILITGATGGIGNCLVEKFNSLECKNYCHWN